MIPDQEGDGEEHTARYDLLQWGLEEPTLGCQRINPLVEDGDEE